PQPAPVSLATSVPAANASASMASWTCRLDGSEGLVLAEDLTHRAADLSQRAVRVHGLDDGGHHVLLAFGGVAQAGKGALRSGRVALVAQLLELGALLVRQRLIDLEVVGLGLIIVA